ncbi:GNAT family N-acetyltransferase [Altererythrobacter sp. KTW20L]|nr:GNAT family N-acetyltransferase [Altererythrobacter sp. KTW20L]
MAVPFDPVDAIMAVMHAAFDPAYGEAWNRRQIGDTLVQETSHFLLFDADGRVPASVEQTAGFTLSRKVLEEEEELLLIAVVPQARGRGVGSALLRQFIETATARGSNRLFLEMRAGNPAQALYLRHGFAPVGRRINYYRTGTNGPCDAITYARSAS